MTVKSIKRPNAPHGEAWETWQPAQGYVYARHKNATYAHLVRKDRNPRVEMGFSVKQWKRVRRSMRHAAQRKAA